MRTTRGSLASFDSAAASTSTNTAFSTACTWATTRALRSAARTVPRNESCCALAACLAFAVSAPLAKAFAAESADSRMMTRLGPTAPTRLWSSAPAGIPAAVTGACSFIAAIDAGNARSNRGAASLWPNTGPARPAASATDSAPCSSLIFIFLISSLGPRHLRRRQHRTGEQNHIPTRRDPPSHLRHEQVLRAPPSTPWSPCSFYCFLHTRAEHARTAGTTKAASVAWRWKLQECR